MTIEDLIGQLELAHEPNRWLDAKLDAMFRIGTEKMRAGGYEWAWSNFPIWAHHKQAMGMCGCQHDNGDLGLIWNSEPFTASLDGAVLLVERALPGWYWRVGRTSLFPDGWAFISRLPPDHCDRKDEAACADGKAANPAIGLLIAALRAVQARG